MAELYIDGRQCGVAFWPPQRFRIPAGPRAGEPVALRLTVTGSRANRYGRPVWYGLKK